MPLFLGCTIGYSEYVGVATTNAAIAKNTIKSGTGSSTGIDFLVVVSGDGTAGATRESIMNDYALMILDLLSLRL